MVVEYGDQMSVWYACPKAGPCNAPQRIKKYIVTGNAQWKNFF